MSNIEPLRIESLAFGGAGVARLASGKVALVHGAAPDELVRVRPLEDKRSYLIAEVRDVLEPSPARIEPPCPSADRCGGCPWMHLAPETQRSWKLRLLRSELERAGLLSRPELLADMIRGETLGHRSRTRMHRRGDRFGTLAARSHEVVPLVECPILSPELRAFAADLASALDDAPPAEVEVELYADVRGRRGLWIELRPHQPVSPWPEIAEALGVEALRVVTTRGRPLLERGGPLEEDSAGRPLAFAPGVFVQSNRELNARLVETALAGAGRGDRFAELYAGAGNFTVHLAREFRRGLAVEASRPALALLRRNLRKVSPRVVARADKDRRAARYLATRAPVDLLLADPPRAGIKPLRPLFETTPPRRVVLISCHPMAAVRDLSHLCRTAGYRLESVVPVDLFPGTPHLELVAVLSGGRGPGAREP